MEMSKKAKEIMSKYTLFAPIIKKHVKEEEEKLGRKLTKNERNIFINSDRRRLRTKAALFAAVIGLSTGGIAIAKALPEGRGEDKEIVSIDNNNGDFKKQIKVEETPIISQNDEIEFEKNKSEHQVIGDILGDYNLKYNKNLKYEDLGFLKLKPNCIYVEGDYYLYDYRQKSSDMGSTENVEDIYVILDDKREIISSIGNIDKKYVNVDTKIARAYGGKEYFPSNERIDITKNIDGTSKDQDEVKKIYDGVEKAYEDRLKEKEAER